MLSGTYLDLNTFYHGDSVRASEKIRMEWARIPHFYYNFYVYKYATGFSAAVAFSENILSGNNKKIEAYINFLKAGDSKDVLDILKDAGVDLSSPAPIKAALDKFAETLEMLKENLSGD
jgi:oligoendopeptidase F